MLPSMQTIHSRILSSVPVCSCDADEQSPDYSVVGAWVRPSQVGYLDQSTEQRGLDGECYGLVWLCYGFETAHTMKQ